MRSLHFRSNRAFMGSVLAFALAAFGLAACGTSATSEADGDLATESAKPLVVTTVAPITSIVATIVGPHIEVSGIVPEGTNSHTFEPPPSAAELLAGADLVILNGLQLEEPTRQLAEANVADGVSIVQLGDETIDPEQYLYDFSFPEADGKPNPHLWTDPTLVITYATIVRDEMIDLDPENADDFNANYDAFVATIEEFSNAMIASFDTIDPGDRKLVTYHDAYAYFAQTYEWTVIGAAQPADFGEPTARDIADLIDQINAENVRAVFGSEVFPSPVLEQISAETGALYVDELRDDDLPGEPGEAEHSWLGLMKFNFITMTEALGGDATELKNFEPGSLPTDEATYAQ